MGHQRRSPTAEETRYSSLKIAAALSRPWDYPTACAELASVLRGAYSGLPKPVQGLVFNDTLLAFRILPEVQTGYGVPSATVLHRAAEACLPKQKRSLANTEYKQSVVAQKRRANVPKHNISGSLILPHDILIDVFSLLDAKSLATASLVCRTWYSAANDDLLWKQQCSLFFGASMVKNISVPSQLNLEENNLIARSSWKMAFQKECQSLSLKLSSNRGLCMSCSNVIWLSDMKRMRSHRCNRPGNIRFALRPVYPQKVVGYLQGESWWDRIEKSDSDDDESEEFWYYLFKPWDLSS